jgi:hypothetical protein
LSLLPESIKTFFSSEIVLTARNTANFSHSAK